MPDPIYFAPLRVPLVDPRTGLMAREWYLFFQALWLRTGGTEAPTPDGTLLLASQPTPDDNEAAKVISAILQLPDQLSGTASHRSRATERCFVIDQSTDLIGKHSCQ
jgi:hypothetical protein